VTVLEGISEIKKPMNTGKTVNRTKKELNILMKNKKKD